MKYDSRRALALHAKIAACKSQKNWKDAAIYLEEQKALHGDYWSDTELAKMLQKAGDFDAAILEILWLESHADKQTTGSGWSHLSTAAKNAKLQSQMANIYKAAALICKREKRMELHAEYKRKEDIANRKASGLRPRIEQERSDFISNNPSHPVVAIMSTEEYQLNKQATAFKKAGQMDEAIAALYRVREIKGVDYDDDKLAKYLQAAGRFDEAIEVIEQMLEDAIPAYAKNLNHQPKSVEDSGRASYCMRLCGSALQICEKAKRPDVAARFQQMQTDYKAEWERLEPIATAELKQKKTDWEQASKQGREAMAAFFQKYRRRA